MPVAKLSFVRCFFLQPNSERRKIEKMIRSHCCSYNTLSSNNIIISLRRRSRGRIHHNLNQFQRFISTESHGSSISSSLPSASPSTSITDQEPYHDTTNKTARDRLLFSNSSSSSNSLSNTTSNVDVILSSNPIESGSSTTTTTETATTTATGLPLPRHMTRQGREIIPFNTHKFIQAVEQGSGFHTSLAEGIMRATATLLSNRQERVEREVTSRQDLENVRPRAILSLSIRETFVRSTALTTLRFARTVGISVLGGIIRVKNVVLTQDV